MNSDGKLGALVSSRRFKDEINPMDLASKIIYELRPVSFRYKREIEPTRPSGYGLISEEVEKVNADLVIRDRDGKANSVRYDAVNAMLLNEFLKEHKKVEQQSAQLQDHALKIQEQQSAIAELKSLVVQQQKGSELLNAQINAQAAQIEKLSAGAGEQDFAENRFK